MSPLNKYLFLLIAISTLFSSFGQNSLNTSGTGLRWVSAGDIDVSGNQITVEAIFRKSTTANATNLVSKHTDEATCNYLLRPNSFQMTTNNAFYVCINTQPTVQNTWYHAAATYDGSIIKYYINGCLINSIPASGNLVTNDFLTGIGMQAQNPTATTENFKGNIDEVRIWNIARTEQEIQLNMNFLLPTNQPGLLAYYKFNNNYTNSQGNALFDGVPQGTLSFDVEAPVFIPLAIVSALPTDASCYGFSDGSLAITAVGTGALTYSLDGTTYVANSTFNNLSAGPYTVYVKSPQGCIVNQTFTIGEPPQVPTPVITYPSPLCETDDLALHIDPVLGATCSWSGPNGFFTSNLDTVITNSGFIHSGNYSAFFTLNGCSSDTLVQTITVNPIYSFVIDTTICSNEVYVLGSQNLNTAGSYTLQLQTVAGCDSIINLNLSINPAYDIQRDTSICEGEVFVFQGQSMTTTGTYPFYLQTTLGCDSTITYNLIVYPIPAPPVITTNSPVECPGDLFTFVADSVQGGSFEWFGENNFTSTSLSNSFNAEIEDMGFYASTVTVNGCTSPPSEIELIISKIYTFDDFDFPNVLTPNGDGLNDEIDLESYFQTCQEFTFYLFDRLGNLVYQQEAGEQIFEGKHQNSDDMMEGVYLYKLVYERGEKNGFIHLIR
ncbi:MAG: LamG-like jellyroll fold domain-containing protein [Crocinitomicaceae bacterium]